MMEWTIAAAGLSAAASLVAALSSLATGAKGRKRKKLKPKKLKAPSSTVPAGEAASDLKEILERVLQDMDPDERKILDLFLEEAVEIVETVESTPANSKERRELMLQLDRSARELRGTRSIAK